MKAFVGKPTSPSQAAVIDLVYTSGTRSGYWAKAFANFYPWHFCNKKNQTYHH